MKVEKVNSLVTKFVILTLFQSISMTWSWPHRKSGSSKVVKYLTHIPLRGGRRYTGTVDTHESARPGQFPWMALIQNIGYFNVDRCGGTVISSRWVLTAAHCIGKYPKRILVVFGDVSKRYIYRTSYNGPGVAMMAKRAVVHPRFHETHTNVINDVGLLFMPRDIPFGRTIKPIAIAGPSHRYESHDRHMALIVGWGDIGQQEKSTVLRWGRVPIISNSLCSRYWNQVNDDEICTEPKTGNDVCKGDSGGPLVLPDPRDGVLVQYGIVSYGDKYCPSSAPSVFTSVSSHAEWILRITSK